MVITDANEFVAEVHARMPVILEADQFEPWLSGSSWPQNAETCRERCAAKMACVEADEITVSRPAGGAASALLLGHDRFSSMVMEGDAAAQRA